jgi:hypothetical protein
VRGTYAPVGDLIVDGCIVAIALVVIWARPRNPIGWLMLAFAALGATQNFTEAYGVRALADPQAQLRWDRWRCRWARRCGSRPRRCPRRCC